MTKFFLWHKCDWCGNWTFWPLSWIRVDGKEYCTGACAEKKSMRLFGVEGENRL